MKLRRLCILENTETKKQEKDKIGHNYRKKRKENLGYLWEENKTIGETRSK